MKRQSGPKKIRAREPVDVDGFVFDAQLCVSAKLFRRVLARIARRRDSSRHAARTRVHDTAGTSRAPSRLLSIPVFSRAPPRAIAGPRGARARRRARRSEVSGFYARAFRCVSRVSLASAARSSDTLAARRRRGALSESHARAGLTARRARRPRDVARGLLLWLSPTTKNVSPEATTMAPVARVARGRIRRSNRHIAPARPRRTACSRATCVPASVLPRACARPSGR